MKNFFKEAPNKMMKIESNKGKILGKALDHSTLDMIDKVKMLLNENEIQLGEDLTKFPLVVLTRIAEMLKETPRRQSLVVGRQYTDLVIGQIAKIIESAETALRA